MDVPTDPHLDSTGNSPPRMVVQLARCDRCVRTGTKMTRPSEAGRRVWGTTMDRRGGHPHLLRSRVTGAEMIQETLGIEGLPGRAPQDLIDAFARGLSEDVNIEELVELL